MKPGNRIIDESGTTEHWQVAKIKCLDCLKPVDECVCKDLKRQGCCE